MSRLETTEWIGWERSSRDRAGRGKKEESCRAEGQKAKGQKELRGSFIFSSFPEMPDPQNYG
jgi:hypothetical protein